MASPDKVRSVEIDWLESAVGVGPDNADQDSSQWQQPVVLDVLRNKAVTRSRGLSWRETCPPPVVGARHQGIDQAEFLYVPRGAVCGKIVVRLFLSWNGAGGGTC